MTILNTLIQAVLQGLTEFLPISSSGHLKLWQILSGQPAAEGNFLTVVLHMGTLAAVLIAFRETIRELLIEALRMLRDIFRGRFRVRDMNPARRMLLMLMLSLLPLIPCYFVREIFSDVRLPVLALCFLFTAAELFFASRIRSADKTAEKITSADALLIGLFQCAALFPGISRSGSTVSAARFCGIEKETAVRYSFILGIPAILGGCLSELHDAAAGTVTVDLPSALLGFLVSAVTGILAIRLLRKLLRSDSFTVFSVYTFLLSLLTAAIWLLRG